MEHEVKKKANACNKNRNHLKRNLHQMKTKNKNHEDQKTKQIKIEISDGKMRHE